MQTRVLCVLGMHRSGTSCLTGTLEEAGVFLGEVSQHDPSNAKGHRENEAIIALHKSLLHANGGSWYAPPRAVRWTSQHRQQRDGLISKYAAKTCWGFKDPRTVLALEGWQEALPQLRLAGIFRHPLAVAKSLQSRDAFPINKGLKLWYHYNEQLLAHYERQPFPLISFDAEPEVFKGQLNRLLKQVGLNVDISKTTFFDPKLRHEQSEPVETLPRYLQNMYYRLCALTV